MASDNLNFTNITNNRPGYAIPITFIGLFILIPIVTAFINKFKEIKSVDINYNSKLLLLVFILIVILLCIIALFIEFNNCIKYDIQMKIGERLIDLCGGSQYYQRESPDELIASMIYKKNTDPKDVEGSPIKYNARINIILNVIYLIIFLIYSIILLNRIILLILDNDQSLYGKIPIITFISRLKLTKTIERRLIGCIIVIILLGYIGLYIIAFTNKFTKKSKSKPNIIRFTISKVGFIGFIGFLLWVATKAGIGQSNIASSEFMQLWNSSNILKILFIFSSVMALLLFSYKSSYEQLPEIVNKYMAKCEDLNSHLVSLINSESVGTRFKNIVYKNILDLEPSVSDPVNIAIQKRYKNLYQYIKHNNGKELLQLENKMSTNDLETIRSKMKELRNYKNLRDTFRKYNNKVFILFALFVITAFYVIFNYNYKINKSQVTLLTVISIVILIIVTTIFGWFSNAILMN